MKKVFSCLLILSLLLSAVWADPKVSVTVSLGTAALEVEGSKTVDTTLGATNVESTSWTRTDYQAFDFQKGGWTDFTNSAVSFTVADENYGGSIVLSPSDYSVFGQSWSNAAAIFSTFDAFNAWVKLGPATVTGGKFYLRRLAGGNLSGYHLGPYVPKVNGAPSQGSDATKWTQSEWQTDRLQGDGVDLDIAIPGTGLHAELAVSGASSGEEADHDYRGLQFGGRVWGNVVDNVGIVASYRYLREAPIITSYTKTDLFTTTLDTTLYTAIVNYIGVIENSSRNNIGVYGKFGLLDGKLGILAGYGVTFVSIDGLAEKYTDVNDATVAEGIKYTNNFHGIDLRLGYQLTDKISIASDHNVSFGTVGWDYKIGATDTNTKTATFVYFGSLGGSIGLSDKLAVNLLFRETAASLTKTVEKTSTETTEDKQSYNEIKIDVGLGYAVSKNASVSAGVELEFDTYTTEKVSGYTYNGVTRTIDKWVFGIPVGITVKF
jgi:hypothetical protein